MREGVRDHQSAATTCNNTLRTPVRSMSKALLADSLYPDRSGMSGQSKTPFVQYVVVLCLLVVWVQPILCVW